MSHILWSLWAPSLTSVLWNDALVYLWLADLFVLCSAGCWLSSTGCKNSIWQDEGKRESCPFFLASCYCFCFALLTASPQWHFFTWQWYFISEAAVADFSLHFSQHFAEIRFVVLPQIHQLQLSEQLLFLLRRFPFTVIPGCEWPSLKENQL